MACGDSYADLAVTSGGRTLADPYGIALTGPGAYFEWYALTEQLVTQANDRFQELGRVEEAQGSYPHWNDLVNLQNKMIGGLDNLTAPALSFDHNANIDQAIAVIRDALCLMERSDAGIASYEGGVTTTRRVWPWLVGGAAGTAAFLAFVYGARKIFKRKRTSNRRALRAA